MKTEAETGVARPQAREHPWPPTLEMQGAESPPAPTFWRARGPADALVLDSRTSEW